MNPYLKNLNKIEFVLTYACTGRCRHCSQGEHPPRSAHFPPQEAARIVRRVHEVYPLHTAMTFGGEPLLYPESVYAVMSCAREAGIPHRQVITNGCFSADPRRRREVAKGLRHSGVNDLLVSVDVFHQETLPLDTVKDFALACLKEGLHPRLQPAWLEGPQGKNPLDETTRRLLREMKRLGMEEASGNIIFPEGRAKDLPQEYFTLFRENPYREDPSDLRCLSLEPDGSLLHSNVREKDVLQILEEYHPSLI